MEKFEVYNRELNKWDSENISIVPGWTENWVLDKTTDTMSLKLKYKGKNAPNFNVGDWCRILHSTPTYEGINIKLKDTTEFQEEYEYIKSISSVTYDANIGTNGGFIITQSENVNRDVEYTLVYPILKGDKEILKYAYLKIPAIINRVTYYILPTETFVEDSSMGYQIGVRLYEQAYKPSNHEQYVIGDITLVENKIAGEWDCQVKLKEPIEITNGIVCETMSFTNQISKTVDDIVYKHTALNHFNVLEKILKVTPANNDLQKSWWSRIKICNQQFLINLPFNDETYSEPSLYNILMDKYDSSTGRTPVLYFDINPETDLPNDLTRETYVLNFERQDGFDKPETLLEQLAYNHNEIIINKSDANFTDGLISNYDNLSLENASVYVSEDLWAVPEINNNDRVLTEYNIDSEKGIWVLRTPHNIKKIISIKRLDLIIEYYMGDDSRTKLKRTTKDVSSMVLEKKQYLASEKYNTRDVIWFEEGTNVIHLNDYYYYNNEGYDLLGGAYKLQNLKLYRVEYEPLVSGRYDLGKDYQTPINQIDSQIDSRKFGEYLTNYFASMNKADLIVQKTVGNFYEIVDVGTRVRDGYKDYIITNVSIQNRGYDYEVVYQLNENHIRKSDTIVAPQEIRKNIEISINATKERKSMLNFDLKIGLGDKIDNSQFDTQFRRTIFSTLLTNFTFRFIEIAKLDIFSHLTKTNGEIIPYNISRLCEIARYSIGNTFCFNMKYYDNAEAGKQKNLTLTLPVLEGEDVKLGSVENQLPILYTDSFGEFETFNLNLINTHVGDLPDCEVTAGLGSWAEELFKTRNAIAPLVNYPATDGLENLSVDNILTINNINYYKDMLDIFNYTIGFNIVPDENIILCKSFFNNSLLMRKPTSNEQIYMIKTYNRNLTENDYRFANDEIQYTTVTGFWQDYGVDINLDEELSVAKSVVLVDASHNPVIIINNFDRTQTNNSFKTIKLYC